MEDEFFEDAPPMVSMPRLGTEVPLYCTRGMSRDEWLSKRLGTRSIGASQVAAVLGESKYGTPIEVWGEVLGRTRKEDEPTMQLGRAIESFVSERVARHFGFADEALGAMEPLPETDGVYDWPYVIRHGSIPFLTANLDRVLRTEGKTKPLEIKWHGWRIRDHYDDFKRYGMPAIKGTPIMSHYIQLQTQMAIIGAGCDTGVLGVVVGEEAGMRLSLGIEIDEKDLFIFVVKRDEGMISRIESGVTDFWNKYVLTGVMPPVTSYRDEAAARAAYSGEGVEDRKAKEGLQRFDDMLEHVERYMSAKDSVKLSQEKELEEKARLIRELEIKRISSFSCDGYNVTYNSDINGVRKLMVKEWK